MKINLHPHHQKHVMDIGIPEPPSELEVSAEEYEGAMKMWESTGFRGEDLRTKVAGHLAWKHHHKTKALPTKKPRNWEKWYLVTIGVLLIIVLLSVPAHCQFSKIKTVSVTDGVTTLFTAGPFSINFTSGCTVTGTGSAWSIACTGGAGGSGTVTSVSDLAPLFTTATRTTTPAFSLTNSAAHTVFGNNTAGSAVPTYFVPACADLSNAGAFCSGTAYSSLTGTPQLAITKAAVASNWLNSYTSSTGVFTAAQPAFTDISGSLGCGQLPALTTDVVTSGCAATIQANAVTQTKVTNGYVDLSSTQATIAGTKTFTGATNNTNTTTGISDCIRDGMYIAGSSCYATIAAAVSAAPSGGTVYSIPGHSETIASAISITKPLVIILDGNVLTCTVNSLTSGCFAVSGTVVGVEIFANNNTSLTLSGTNVVGVTLNGTITDALIQGFNITGSGVTADGQYGVLEPDTATAIINKIRITDNSVTSTMVGIAIYNQTLATSKGVVIDHNHITGMVGVLSGQGYGIAVAGATSQPADTRVEFNYIELSQRHDIYISQGSGAVVMGNVSRLHRQAVTTGVELPAFEIGRSQGITLVGNFIDQSYDGGIQVFTDPAGQTSRNTVIADNVINNGQYYDIMIGTTSPSTDGFPTQVIVQGNSIYKTGINNFGIYLASGKDISILDNIVQNNTTTSDVFRIEGSSETAGTATYTDRIFVRGNNFIGTGSGAGISFAATAAASGINFNFSGNRVNAPSAWFASGGAAITDVNMKVFDSDAAFNAAAFLTTKAYVPIQSWSQSFFEQAAVAAAAGTDVVYADATAHALKASYNNSAFSNIPLTGLTNVFSVSQTFTAGLQTGASPPACTAGTAGFMCNGEGTAPTNVASTAAIYPSSTTHEYMAATNGASTATPGMMVRVQPSPINNTAKTAAVTTATLCAAAAGACNTAGQYRLTYNVWGSGTACATVTAGSLVLNFTWTDENAVTHTTINAPMWDQKTAAMTSGQVNFNTALGTEGGSGSFIISTNGTIIQYATTYTACTSGTGTYNLRIAAERLQ